MKLQFLSGFGVGFFFFLQSSLTCDFLLSLLVLLHGPCSLTTQDCQHMHPGAGGQLAESVRLCLSGWWHRNMHRRPVKCSSSNTYFHIKSP